MKHSISTAATLAAATMAVVAVPAAAQAAQHAVIIGPVPVHGYQMSVLGISGEKSLTIALERDRGTSTQQHIYTFTRSVEVTDGRIRANLGSLGSVDLKLKTGRDTTLPAGCKGHAIRQGTWNGSVRLVADSTYFHTIRAHHLPGAVLPVSGTGCDEQRAPKTAPGAATLTAAIGDTYLEADATTASVLSTTRRGGASIVHVITVAGRLDAATDLSTATFTPTGSLLSGSVTYAGSTSAATQKDGPAGETSVGRLTGELIAHFDSIGDVKVGATPATLQRLP
jgi:hypothetical protein